MNDEVKSNVKDSNIVYVGNKESSAYILAVTKQKALGNSKVVLKARGRCISHAVDIEEQLKNQYIPGLTVDAVKFSTEVINDTEKNRNVRVSTIEIILNV